MTPEQAKRCGELRFEAFDRASKSGRPPDVELDDLLRERRLPARVVCRTCDQKRLGGVDAVSS